MWDKIQTDRLLSNNKILQNSKISRLTASGLLREVEIHPQIQLI